MAGPRLILRLGTEKILEITYFGDIIMERLNFPSASSEYNSIIL